MQRLGDVGDTIVEVLIVIAVVGLILAGAFVSSNRSTQVTRTAQERGEALKVAETQLERIKIAKATGAPTLATSGTFCFDISGAYFASTTCSISPLGLEYRATVTAVSLNRYSVRVEWDALAGASTNKVQLDYNVE